MPTTITSPIGAIATRDADGMFVALADADAGDDALITLALYVAEISSGLSIDINREGAIALANTLAEILTSGQPAPPSTVQ